jgi:hypothetical protein
MTKEYEKQFGVEFSTIRPPSKHITDMTDQARRLNSTGIAYAGSIGAGSNEEALLQFGRTLERHSPRCKLDLFSFSDPGELGALENVVVNGGYSAPEIYRQLAGKRFGLVAFNLDERNSRFIRLSWPSKLSDYLGLGLTPIYFGPPCEASDVIQRHRLGYVAFDADTLGDLLARFDSLDEHAVECIEFAKAELSLEQASVRLLNALAQAAGSLKS